MNAYELADCLEALCRESKGSFTKDAVNMLRQQADRIAVLEKCLFQMQNACIDLCFSEAYANQSTKVTEDLLLDRIKELELQLFKVTNRTIATRKKLSKVKKEKIRAYDNGFEDGQKANTQLHPLSDEEIKKCVIAWVKQIYGNEYVTPSDRHIINGTKLIRLAEKRIFKNDSL